MSRFFGWLFLFGAAAVLARDGLAWHDTGSLQFETLNTSLRDAAVIAFLGLCTCGLIVGAFISFAQTPWLVHGVPVLGILGAALASFLFGAGIGWYLFAGRIHKVRIARWLKRR